ncbi:MAG: hypothetical protein RL417_1379 [Pseudomonadota bacterium]|jgi:hypothetical protein
MNLRWLHPVLLTVLFLLRGIAAADEVFIEQVRRLSFDPTEAFFLVAFDEDRVVRFPATVVRISTDGRRGDGSPQAYGAVARIRPPLDVKTVSFSAVFFGRGAQIEFVVPVSLSLAELRNRTVSTDRLREELLQRKAVLGSWRMQVQAQEESLKRLRTDAEVIGDFGRIIDKKEEIDRVKVDLGNVKGDIENLSRFLKLAKTRPAPVNQVGREAQLVKQLSEITQVSHSVELTEMRRRAGAEAELQRKLALIEATRQEDLAALTSELERLKRGRRDAVPEPTEGATE